MKEETNSRDEFLAFLNIYERNRLRSLARHIGHLPHFGFAFRYHNRDGADLMYRGQKLGQVRRLDETIAFDPPLRRRAEPWLSDDVFDEWVSGADNRKMTRALPELA